MLDLCELLQKGVKTSRLREDVHKLQVTKDEEERIRIICEKARKTGS